MVRVLIGAGCGGVKPKAVLNFWFTDRQNLQNLRSRQSGFGYPPSNIRWPEAAPEYISSAHTKRCLWTDQRRKASRGRSRPLLAMTLADSMSFPEGKAFAIVNRARARAPMDLPGLERYVGIRRTNPPLRSRTAIAVERSSCRTLSLRLKASLRRKWRDA